MPIGAGSIRAGSCFDLFPFSHKVVPIKSVGSGGGLGFGYRTSCDQYIGVTIFFLFLNPSKIGLEVNLEWSRRSEMFGYVSFPGWLPLP